MKLLDPKHPAETLYPIEFDLTRELGGNTCTSATITATVYRGVDPSPQSIVVGSATTDGTVVTQKFSNGVDGVDYELKVEALTDTPGQKIVLIAILPVKSRFGAVGDYGVTFDMIIRRLGEERVIQLTDDDGSGTIDTEHLEEAVLTVEADLNLAAARYHVIPLRTSAGAVPVGITRKVREAACWQLMSRRSEFLRGGTDEGDFWEKRRKEWTDFLDGIQASGDDRKFIAGATELAVATSVGTASVVSDDAFFTSTKGYW
jgi:hypothetical protein